MKTAGTARYACAGHDPPVVFDSCLGEFVDFGKEGGLPLGIAAGQTYKEATFEKLRAGQVMVIGTDGVWEAKNKSGEQFGHERFRAAIHESAERTAAEIERHLFSRLLDFADGDGATIRLEIVDGIDADHRIEGPVSIRKCIAGAAHDATSDILVGVNQRIVGDVQPVDPKPGTYISEVLDQKPLGASDVEHAQLRRAREKLEKLAIESRRD